MERLEYDEYEYFVCDVSDRFNSLKEEFGDISIIAKYTEANNIISELLRLGYNIVSIDLHMEEVENYYDEYIIGLNSDGVWCEKFKRRNKYFKNETSIIYIMDNCSSNVIRHCVSDEIYEVSIGKSVNELFKTFNDT